MTKKTVPFSLIKEDGQRKDAGRNAASLKSARRVRVETHCPTISDERMPLFRFIDLFAGIGGIRKGFESAGGQCVFTIEWNDWCKKTYLANFGEGHPFIGDIVQFPEEKVPEHDVLLAGFPCQPFSLAGVSKKNALGRPHGFECTTQGTLFFFPFHPCHQYSIRPVLCWKPNWPQK